MNVAVRYYTKSGNTKKLADAIATAVGVESKTVDEPLYEKVDVLFLGSAVYAAGIDDAVKDFIIENRFKIGKIVNFSTAALLPSTYKQVKKFAEQNGVAIDTQEFHCKGAFGAMHKGKPDANDIEAAKSFAKQIVS